MFVLFFLIHTFFSFIFFMLHAYIEAAVFFILAIVSVFVFWPFWWTNWEKESSEISKFHYIHFKKHVWFFFQKMLFPLSLIFFYSALFWIVWSLEESIGFQEKELFYGLTILVSLITGVTLAFFSSSFSEKTIGKILENLSLFFWFWSFYLLSQIGWSGIFLDTFIATILIGTSAWIIISGKFFISHATLLAFNIFLYLFLSVQWGVLFFGYVPWIFACSAIVYGIALFEWSSFSTLRRYLWFLRTIAVVMLYIGSILLSGFYLLELVWPLSIIALLMAGFFHLYLHKRFENYSSFFLALLIITFFFLRIVGVGGNFFLWMALLAIFSFGLSYFGAKEFSLRMYDRYFVQGFAIAVPLISYLSRGWFYWFGSLLEFFSILLFFSVLSSYFFTITLCNLLNFLLRFFQILPNARKKTISLSVRGILKNILKNSIFHLHSALLSQRKWKKENFLVWKWSLQMNK